MTQQRPPQDNLKALIGREETSTAPEEIGRAFIRLFAMATDDWNPLYHDQAAAKQSRHRGIVAPPTLVCETGQYHHGHLGPSGGFQARSPLPPILAGGVRVGNEYQFFRTVRPSDVVTARSRLVEVTREQGRSGPLAFLTSEITYTNQKGQLLAINRETMLHRVVSPEQGGRHAAP